jgi:hypothetical protein
MAKRLISKISPERSSRSLPARYTKPTNSAQNGVCSLYLIVVMNAISNMVGVAQLAECYTVNVMVGGSSPLTHPNLFRENRENNSQHKVRRMGRVVWPTGL